MLKIIVEKYLITMLIAISTLMSLEKVSAQSSRPLGAQFYDNQFLSNPAFAGLDYGLTVNLNYRNQWKSIAGSPVTMSISGDYRFESVGVGFNVYQDKAGLLSKTQIKGTYAYHLPLYGDKRDLHFGVSLAIMQENLDDANIIAESGDVLAEQFNQRKIYMDGDFGIVYTTERLTLQATLPNLGGLFFHKNEQNTINGYIYFAAISYKIGADPDVLSIEPKISIRGAKGVDNIVDIGSNLKLKNDMLSFMAMYHSDKSATLGLGLNYDKYFIQFFYTSQQTNGSQDFGGDFEINLKVNLWDY